MLSYIDLMEKVLKAYSEDEILNYVRRVEEKGLEEHGFPRLTANIGILISHGRQTQLKDIFIHMMDLCCAEIPVALIKNGKRAGNDFSVKEIVLCLMEAEKAGFAGEEKISQWKDALKKLDPNKTYSAIAKNPPEPMGNWAAFAAASEQLRKYAGLGNETAFIENQVGSQLFSFDENGMYRDPDQPIVYDIATRLQLALTLYFGFDGKCRAKLEDNLLKSADITLKMQSVTGEIPFGGRSNQFLHNEAFYAAIFEFYAGWFRKLGDLRKAGMFKRAAKIATYSVLPWLSGEKIRHIKNGYPTDSMIGCEDYAYFDKYMITTASWFYLAHIMSDDTVQEFPCPSENENYICQTSEWFHKVFVKYRDYFVEFDTDADTHYDAAGIGRIHRKGVFPTVCLSVPFAKSPLYKTETVNPSGFSISGGIIKNGTRFTGWDSSVKYRLTEKSVTGDSAIVKFECTSEGEFLFSESCKITDGYVEIAVNGEGTAEIYFPALLSDGENYSKITCTGNCVEIGFNESLCRYSASDNVTDLNLMYSNRNGKYRSFSVSGKNEVRLRIELLRQ